MGRFKTGDWVEAAKQLNAIQPGDIGVWIDNDNTAWIRFGKVKHTADGKCKKGHGWFVGEGWFDELFDPYTPTRSEVEQMRQILTDPSILDGCKTREEKETKAMGRLQYPIKRGTALRVRQWVDMELEFGLRGGTINCSCGFVPDMREYCGKEFVVDEDIVKEGAIETPFAWSWSTDMVEYAYPETSIKTTPKTEGDPMNPTIAKLYEKTADAVLVQKWFGPYFDGYSKTLAHGDDYSFILHEDKADALLKRAQQLEAAESKKEK